MPVPPTHLHIDFPPCLIRISKVSGEIREIWVASIKIEITVTEMFQTVNGLKFRTFLSVFKIKCWLSGLEFTKCMSRIKTLIRLLLLWVCTDYAWWKVSLKGRLVFFLLCRRRSFKMFRVYNIYAKTSWWSACHTSALL